MNEFMLFVEVRTLSYNPSQTNFSKKKKEVKKKKKRKVKRKKREPWLEAHCRGKA